MAEGSGVYVCECFFLVGVAGGGSKKGWMFEDTVMLTMRPSIT